MYYFQYNLLKQKGNVIEIAQFAKSKDFNKHDNMDDILNSFQEWLVGNTDYDIEQEYKLGYDKQSGTNKTVS